MNITPLLTATMIILGVPIAVILILVTVAYVITLIDLMREIK